MRKLADQATYSYVDGSRYWYSTQPSVNRMADERAERYHPEDVFEHIRHRLQAEAKSRGDFAKVQPCPGSFSEVVDEPEAKLVILGPDYPHSAKSTDSPAMQAAAQILDRGGAGRNCGNMLVFVASDKTRLADLDKAARLYMAWESIEKQKEDLDLGKFQKTQVEQKLKSADQAVRARIPETYCWLLTPGQKRPEPGQPLPAVEWTEDRLKGEGGLAERASEKLRDSELLITSMAGTRLRLEIDQVPLWRADHVGVKQLVDDFAKYLYLPRVKNAQWSWMRSRTASAVPHGAWTPSHTRITTMRLPTVIAVSKRGGESPSSWTATAWSSNPMLQRNRWKRMYLLHLRRLHHPVERTRTGHPFPRRLPRSACYAISTAPPKSTRHVFRAMPARSPARWYNT